ncbi:MAG: chemotaxis protein CheB [Myxococcales bacterium]
MTRPLAVALDDEALRVFPRLDVELAARGVRVLRSFASVPDGGLLGRVPECRGAVVVGGKSWDDLVRRLEQAAASTHVPIIGVLPSRAGARVELRWPGVVDLIPPDERRPAERVALMAQIPVVSKAGHAPPKVLAAEPAPRRASAPAQWVVAVASSTGGAWVLSQLLRGLASAGCGDAVLVAQHLDAEFVPFFADWLRESLRVAADRGRGARRAPRSNGVPGRGRPRPRPRRRARPRASSLPSVRPQRRPAPDVGRAGARPVGGGRRPLRHGLRRRRRARRDRAGRRPGALPAPGDLHRLLHARIGAARGARRLGRGPRLLARGHPAGPRLRRTRSARTCRVRR